MGRSSASVTTSQPASAPARDGHEPHGRELQAVRIFLRPIANPFALGFVGVAVASLLTSGIELRWIPASQTSQAAVLILAFAPLVQGVSSLFGFLARDAVAATSMGVQSVTWLSLGLALLLLAPHHTSVALGMLLFVSATGILVSAATAARTKALPAMVLGLTALRYLLTAVFEVSDAGGWERAGGWAGVILCALALYAAASLELEDARHRTVLPTLRRGEGRQALVPDLETQVSDVAAEAGVRVQL